MNNFIITCHGWSASNWLAYVLNQHNDLVVSHSAANLIDTKLSNDINEKIKEFHSGYLNRTEIPISDSYKKIKEAGVAKSYGSVHLYRMRDLPIQSERFGLSESFNVVNLVRNPVDLVWSGYGQFKDLFLTDINELYWTLGKVLDDKDFCYEISTKYDLKLGDFNNLAFFAAARVLGSLRLDLDALDKIKKIPYINYMGHVKMEDVTEQPETLKKLISVLTNNEVAASQYYLDGIYKIGRINKHKKDTKVLTSHERFKSLEDWQKEVLRYYLKKFDIVRPYQTMGYDLSFLS